MCNILIIVLITLIWYFVTQLRQELPPYNMFALLVLFTIFLIYIYLTKNHSYWKIRNVKHEQPVPLFGNMYQTVIGNKSLVEITTELYNKYPNEKVVGFYRGTVPELIIRDLDIIKKILNTDFAYFYQRGLGRDPKREPLFMNLFQAEGDNWKLIRHRLTVAFTTAKLKKMFPLIIECAEKLETVGENIVKNGGECDVKDLMARFTTDFIGACGFGLDANSINNEKSLFREFGKLIFDNSRSWNSSAMLILHNLLPDFDSLYQRLLTDGAVLNITMQILEQALKQRNYKPSGRNDFIDLLIELSEKGKISGESIDKRTEDGTPQLVEMEMDLKCMAAQVFVFFAAGFETSSSATSYLLHKLAYYPEEQKKIQENIDQVLAKYDNKLCFNSISEMTALSQGLKEAMRIFPSVGVLNRVCVKEYTFPELGITLDPGVKIVIPVQAIQTDEKYFTDPFEFQPERFSDEFADRNKYTFLPFGEGPRMCIGSRLGEMQSLAGLAAVLHKFSVEPGPSSRRVPDIKRDNKLVQSVKGGLPLKLKLRKQ